MAHAEVTFIYKSFQLLDSVVAYDINQQHQVSAVSDDKESFEDYFDPKFPRWISILLFIVGLFGNTLCLIIFSQKSMRKNSTFIYLAFLSIVDLIVLTLGLGDIILISYFQLVLRNRSMIVCRFVSFLIYAFTHLSSFILASVSIDRAIATNFINFSKIYCKPKTAYKIIFLNIFLAALINFHSLIFLGYESTPSQPILSVNATTNADYNNLFLNTSTSNKQQTLLLTIVCASKKDTLYDTFMESYFKWIDLLSYAIIPFFTMGVCTFLIVRVLFLSNRRLNTNKRTSVNVNAAARRPSEVNTGASLLPANKKPTNTRANKAKHLTYTLITLNCLFFCLVSPLVIVLIVLTGKETEGLNKILINIVYLLAYSNHSFNFVLYGFSSPPFRQSLFTLFGIRQDKKKIKKNPS